MQRLCTLDELKTGSARGFRLGHHEVIVARPAPDTVAAYLNRCPHLGVPLNWQQDDFMDSDSVFLRCATHGALFEPATGLCVLGPCRGDSLWPLECAIVDNEIRVDGSELAAASGA